MIYLDYASSTPVDNEVLDLFYDTTKKYYANPNSSHKLGIEVKKIIDECTLNIANNLHVLKEEIIYTSGASESNNLAIKGICEMYKNKGKHILVSSIEHDSIVGAAASMQLFGFEAELIPVNKNGLVDIIALKKMIREDTILVSVCAVDSEVGIKQPINEIGELLKNYPNCFFHTDASQAIGKIEIDFDNIDLITISSHKFYGMIGSGILIKKKNVKLKPQINGGRSNTIYRSGTPELANIVACDKALDIAINALEERYKYINFLSNKIKIELGKYENVYINNTINSIPHIINFSLKGVSSLELQKKLESYDIYVSTKTSCCKIESPSRLIYAITGNKNIASSSIRISLSHLTTESQINDFLYIFSIIYQECEMN